MRECIKIQPKTFVLLEYELRTADKLHSKDKIYERKTIYLSLLCDICHNLK
jgi:hypothetical protein